MFGLIDGDLHFIDFDNKKFCMTRIVNKYSGKNNNALTDCLILGNSLKI